MELTKIIWQKASRSSELGDSCVELGALPGAIAIRDSKDPEGPRLLINRSDFQSFTKVLKRIHTA